MAIKEITRKTSLLSREQLIERVKSTADVNTLTGADVYDLVFETLKHRGENARKDLSVEENTDDPDNTVITVSIQLRVN